MVLTEAEYEALFQSSLALDWRFRVALVIAHETGHRIGAIRQLRWSDIDMEGSTVRWRAEDEKTGYEHRTPMTAEALAVLEEARRQSRGIGDIPLPPAPKDAAVCLCRSLARDWWNRAVARAGLEPKRGRGWHSLRRKFASDLMNQPLKVLCELGGWACQSPICFEASTDGRPREHPEPSGQEAALPLRLGKADGTCQRI